MKMKKYLPVKGFTGIYKIRYFDPETQVWSDSKRGGRYAAIRTWTEYGKQKKLERYFQTFEEARTFRGSDGASIAVLKNEKIVSMPIEKQMTMSQLIEQWQRDWLPHKSISTQVRYRSYPKHFEFFRDIPVESITVSIIDQWLACLKEPSYLAQQNATRCNYKHEFSVLSRIFHYYVSRYNRDFRIPLISEHRKMLKVRETKKVVKDLTPEELRAFLKCMREVSDEMGEPAYYYLACVQHLTFSRIQGAAALHIEDVDFKRGKIILNKKIVWPRGKGLKPVLEQGEKVGTGKEVELTPLLESLLKEWMLQSGIRDGLLFTDERRCMLEYRCIEYRYSKALKRAELPFTATHILRHASLSEFYEFTGGDLLATQRVAGHSDLRSTTRYAKVRDSKVAEKQRQFGQKISQAFQTSP